MFFKKERQQSGPRDFVGWEHQTLVWHGL